MVSHQSLFFKKAKKVLVAIYITPVHLPALVVASITRDKLPIHVLSFNYIQG